MIHKRGDINEDGFCRVARLIRTTSGGYKLFYRIHFNPFPQANPPMEGEVEEFFEDDSTEENNPKTKKVELARHPTSGDPDDENIDFCTFEHTLEHKNSNLVRVFIKWTGPHGPREITDRFKIGYEAPRNVPKTSPVDIVIFQEKRLRLSVWCARNNLLDGPEGFKQFINGRTLKSLAKMAKGNLDDISLLDIVQNNKTMNGIVLQPDSGKEEKELTEWQRKFEEGQKKITKKVVTLFIKEAHKNGVQVLVGFDSMWTDNRFPNSFAFLNWIFTPIEQEWVVLPKKKIANPTPEHFGRKLVEFVLEHFPECDGISFDIENVFQQLKITNKDKIIAAGKKLTTFYQTVAKELRKTNKIAAILVATTVADDGKLGIDQNNNPADPGHIRFIVTDWGMVNSNGEILRNMILRPMSYDYHTKGKGKPTKVPANRHIDAYHRGVVEFALKQKGVPSTQFQLGVKVIPPSRDKDGKLTFHPNATAPGELLDTIKKLSGRCVGLCRPQEVGICLFAAPVMKGKWGEINEELNQLAPKSGTLGEPQQVPLNPVQQNRMKEAGFEP